VFLIFIAILIKVLYNQNMKNFKSSENRNGGRERRGGESFGKRDSFKGNSFSKQNFEKGGDFKKKSFAGDRSEIKMNKATCSECSSICEVPFKPSQDRPVFCSNCFMSKRDGTFEKKDERKGNFRENDRREKRDSYSTTSTSNLNANNTSIEVADLKKQINNLNTKIDSLALAFDKFISEKASIVSVIKNTEVTPVAKTVSTKKVVTKKDTIKSVPAKKEVVKSSLKAPAKTTKTVAKKIIKTAPVISKKVVVKKVTAKATTKTIPAKKSVVAKKK
jgi:CxxC-x17-CxxC domain-containing protein